MSLKLSTFLPSKVMLPAHVSEPTSHPAKVGTVKYARRRMRLNELNHQVQRPTSPVLRSSTAEGGGTCSVCNGRVEILMNRPIAQRGGASVHSFLRLTTRA